ncbi:DUF934 domain-containing protein [Tropicimonas sp.]|uniref:DUF934 domain-containing protein n=1 Tax=Tropicimonas sp. TaxID=2067044 RepID=UPI003A886D19
MPVIVTDSGFSADSFRGSFTALADIGTTGQPVALDLPPDTDARDLTDHLPGLEMIRVDFPSFADGRGFSLARTLRRMGYAGRLRARGHVLADQYTMARRSGFDEVEIDDTLAARQPEDQWLARANWREHDYRSRLSG